MTKAQVNPGAILEIRSDFSRLIDWMIKQALARIYAAGGREQKRLIAA